MKKLTKSDIVRLHYCITKQSGGDSRVRDENLLDLSVNSPYQTFGGEDLYDGVMRKAVHLCYSLVMNHPFVDGNKRIGAHALLITLDGNGIVLDYTQEELIDVILKLASSKLSEKELLEWVKNHINDTSAWD